MSYGYTMKDAKLACAMLALARVEFMEEMFLYKNLFGEYWGVSKYYPNMRESTEFRTVI